MLLLAAGSAVAQSLDSATLLAAQTEALKAFAMLDGVWRGPATARQPDGSELSFVQTERIGPFLGGSIRVIEGRGYDAAGQVRFNALGIVSYDVAKRSYTLHSHAQGFVGDFAFTPTGNGYAWEIPLGPAGTMRYRATIENGELVEVGDRVVAGREPARVFEMRLKRIADTEWPAGGAISPK
ncbi:MAG: DUF1579 domain-containing protein [Pseudomonadota bacterium]|nr:DUF1579 domain-containing protein [Pseudomonadota bacterium]